MRLTHDFLQGSADWHQFRLTHFGASEASAMLGISPYKSRTALLREKKTGLIPEVDANTQKVFNRGHEIENLARPLAEDEVGQDLFPVICSLGNLSASCDGLSFDETIAWECKQFNQHDYDLVQGGELPEKHWPQCQQVLYVTGAEKLLFTISDGTEENTAHVWVINDVNQQRQIIDGWAQFEKDLSDFEPEPQLIPAQADPVMALPTLAINVGGSISIQSNLDKFGDRLKSFIDETNVCPENDQDFVNLDQACKILKEAEDALKQAEANALAQTASVDELRRTVSFLCDLARTNRLQFEKIVKTEKENRKSSIISAASAEYLAYYKQLNSDCPVKLIVNQPFFLDAMKGKKLLSSMQDAVNTLLANAKIETEAVARDLKEKYAWMLKTFAESGPDFDDFSFLFSDLEAIIYKPVDDFQLIVTTRISQYQEQERIKAEEAAKAQAEREEQIRIEAEQNAIRKAEAIKTQIAEEAAAKARLEEKERIEAEQNATVSSNQLTPLENLERSPEQNDPVRLNAPSRIDLIQTIASAYLVDHRIAERWLISAFSELTEEA